MERHHGTANDVAPLGDDWLEQGCHLSRCPIGQHFYISGATVEFEQATGRHCLLQAAKKGPGGRLLKPAMITNPAACWRLEGFSYLLQTTEEGLQCCYLWGNVAGSSPAELLGP